MKLIHAVKNNTKKEVNALESHAFGIGDIGKILDILRSKIYSKPIQTLMQEYLSNARDANRENETNKIEVHLPNHNDATLRIRDFGPGIDKKRMLEIFIFYGRSTKENSNTQTGGFGLGSKLAWAYTDSFKIRTFVNGTECVYSADLDESRQGKLNLLSETETSEPNGVEILIENIDPEDFEDFDAAFFRAICFWDENEKPKIMSGETRLDLDREKIWNVNHDVSLHCKEDIERVFSREDSEAGAILAIDGICYTLSNDFIRENKELEDFDSLLSSQVIPVIRVNNGLVEINAARETISENKRTLSVLKPKIKKATEAFNSQIKTALSEKDLGQFLHNAKRVLKFSSRRICNFKEDFLQIEQQGYWNQKDFILGGELMRAIEYTRFNAEAKRERQKRYRADFKLDSVYLRMDEKLSKAKQTQKVKQWQKENGRTEVYLLQKDKADQKDFDLLCDALGAVKTSGIALPKVKKTRESVAEGHVKVEVLYSGSWGDRKRSVEREILLDPSVEYKKTVYLDKNNRDKIEDYDSLRDFLNSEDIELIQVTKTVAKQLEDFDAFISIEDFEKDPAKYCDFDRAVKFAKRVWVDSTLGILDDISQSKALREKIEDKNLREYLEFIGDANSFDECDLSIRRDDFLMRYLLRVNSEVQRAKQYATEAPAWIKAVYPLIQFIGHHYENEWDWIDGERVRKKAECTEKQYNEALIQYLNAAAKGGAK